MTEIVEASELFNADELIIVENRVMNLAPMRPLYGPHREYPRFIDLPPALEKKVTLTLGARRAEYDIDDEKVLLYFQEKMA